MWGVPCLRGESPLRLALLHRRFDNSATSKSLAACQR
jgi:hypothetical protein